MNWMHQIHLIYRSFTAVYVEANSLAILHAQTRGTQRIGQPVNCSFSFNQKIVPDNTNILSAFQLSSMALSSMDQPICAFPPVVKMCVQCTEMVRRCLGTPWSLSLGLHYYNSQQLCPCPLAISQNGGPSIPVTPYGPEGLQHEWKRAVTWFIPKTVSLRKPGSVVATKPSTCSQVFNI